MTLRLRGKVLRVQLRVQAAGAQAAEPLPAEARVLAVGEWVLLASLPAEALLVVDVPAVRQPPEEEASAAAVVEV
jgi:hypothetical protein